MKTLFIFFILTLTVSAQANNEDPIITYGDLLVKEKDHDFGKNSLSLTTGYESGNPLLDVYNLSFSYRRNLYNFFEIGVLGRVYSANKTALFNSVEENFGLLGVEITSEVPKHSYYLSFGIIPLKGRLNFFGLTTLPYQWTVLMGIGERTTEFNRFYGYIWAIESRVLIHSQTSLILNYNQEAEAGFSSRETLTRNQVNIGLAFNF